MAPFKNINWHFVCPPVGALVLVLVSTLTNGHKLWSVTERSRFWIQAAGMSFLHRVESDKVRSLFVREGFGVEPLLLHIERSQMMWLGYLIVIPSGHLCGEGLRALDFSAQLIF